MNEDDFVINKPKETCEKITHPPKISINSDGISKRISFYDPSSSIIVSEKSSSLDSSSIIDSPETVEFPLVEKGELQSFKSTLMMAPLTPLPDSSIILGKQPPSFVSRVQVRKVENPLPSQRKLNLLNLTPISQDNIVDSLSEKKDPIVPSEIEFSSAKWFRLDTLHQIEIDHFPFLNQNLDENMNPKRNQYLEVRNFMITRYLQESSKPLSISLCQSMFFRESTLNFIRIYSFLEHWGLINSSCAFPSSTCVQLFSARKLENSLCISNNLEMLHQEIQKYWNDLTEETYIDENETSCYTCHNPLGLQRYFYRSLGSHFFFCPKCIHFGHYPEEFSSHKFCLLESSKILEEMTDSRVEELMTKEEENDEWFLATCQEYLMTFSPKLTFDDFIFFSSSRPYSLLFSYLDEFFPQFAYKIVSTVFQSCTQYSDFEQTFDCDGDIDCFIENHPNLGEIVKTQILNILSCEAEVFL